MGQAGTLGAERRVCPREPRKVGRSRENWGLGPTGGAWVPHPRGRACSRALSRYSPSPLHSLLLLVPGGQATARRCGTEPGCLPASPSLGAPGRGSSRQQGQARVEGLREEGKTLGTWPGQTGGQLDRRAVCAQDSPSTQPGSVLPGASAESRGQNSRPRDCLPKGSALGRGQHKPGAPGSLQGGRQTESPGRAPLSRSPVAALPVTALSRSLGGGASVQLWTAE